MKVMRDMVPLLVSSQIEQSPRGIVQLADFSPKSRQLLNHLRMTALECRAAARADLFEACAVLSISAPVARNAYAETLVKCLSQALDKTPVIFRPGVEEVSFDEAWLLRAAETAARKDWNSFEFLVRSRVPLSTRRNLASLILSISEQFSLI